MASMVWKYTLKLTEFQTVKMPVGATVLCVQTQGRELCVWVQVSDEFDAQQDMRFIIVGTGMHMPPSVGRYVGTAQVGNFVAHVYLGES